MDDRFDLSATSGEVKKEYFEHPSHGFLSFDPITLAIDRTREGGTPVNVPISLPGKFRGTKQPNVFTCSEPREGNAGCSKWHGCRIGQKWPGVGPGTVIMVKRGRRDASNCYDYFETTRGGRPTSQLHHGLDGWELDFTHTSIPVLGRTGAILAGKLNEESSREAVMASKPKVWEMEIGDLLPPWWMLMKKKGLSLPEAAKLYPELAQEEAPPKPRKAKR